LTRLGWVQTTSASWHWSNDSAIAPCLKMYPPRQLHNEHRRSTMPGRAPQSPFGLAPDFSFVFLFLVEAIIDVAQTSVL
jgi:hypothetical protein